MNILVTGGAGYIGAHMVKKLLALDHEVTVLDDFSSGSARSVLCSDFVTGDIASPTVVDGILSSRKIDAVLLFAALKRVADSVSDPASYYRSNVAGTLQLLDSMLRHEIRRFVFSSSAAVYGQLIDARIKEDHPKNPVSPYGVTKWTIEQVLEHYRSAYDLRSISLRYFNAAGADPDGLLGCPRHESHLLPSIMRAATSEHERLCIYGNDYSTRDGTCLRYYVHVADLCDAHLKALEALDQRMPRYAYNLGSGEGFTVLETLHVVEHVTGVHVPFRIAPRRPGDPAALIADCSAAHTELEWRPIRSEMKTIVDTSWKWHLKNSDEFAPVFNAPVAISNQ